MKNEKYSSDSLAEEEVGTGEAIETPEKSKFLANIYDMLHDLIYILAAVTLLFVFAVRLVGVDGNSMYPTLHHSDYLILESNFIYDPEDIRCGDIVVLNVPYYWETSKSLIVKRVIATEGQLVEIKNGKVKVDGVYLEEEYIEESYVPESLTGTALDYPVTVPEGHIFVLGDNRDNSTDSRDAERVGMVDERSVLGKVWAIILPGETTNDRGKIVGPNDWGRIGLVS